MQGVPIRGSTWRKNNMARLILSVMAIAFVALAIGCSSGGGTAVIPPSEGAGIDGAQNMHYLWGIWQFAADPDAKTLEITPLRTGEFHLNALPFLEPPALVNLTLESLKFTGNIIDADIGLRHPFLGLTEFTGFDVCGIFITNGSVSGFTDTDLVMAGEGDTRLLNPDGYSRWWNPAEFPHGTTISTYKDGLLGTPDSVADYNSTLNAYKYFCDDLQPNDSLDKVTLAKRGMFSAGMKNIRHYTIDMGSALVFNYAVDACWQFPSGGKPWVAPDDFGPGANRPEAWRIEVTEVNNTLWNNGSGSGGDLLLSIDVYDWYNADLNEVKVESPGNFAPVTSTAPTGAGIGYSTYEVDIQNATPGAGSIDLFISVGSESIGYGDLLPGKVVTAYFTYTADVGTEEPLKVIYVDDSNDTGNEDGTQAHPYNTIQEGLAAATAGYYVLVDDSGNNYTGPITLVADVILKSQNWDISDGDDRAGIKIDNTTSCVTGVDDATIDGFDIDAVRCGIVCSGASPEILNCRIVNCYDGQARPIWLRGGSHPHIDRCEVYDVNNATDYGYATFYGISIEDCDAVGSERVVVEHTIVHHVFSSDILGLGGGYCYPHGIYIANSDGVYIKNCIVHDITGGNYNQVYGIRVVDSADVKLVNNTIYDVDKTYYYGEAYGLYFTNCTNLDVRNLIISHVHKGEGGTGGYYQNAYGVYQSGSTYSFEYCDVFDCQTANYNNVTPGTGCISADPLFVNPGTDFHLGVGSPCKDTGDPSIKDWDNSKSDMGAYGGPGGNW